MEFNKNLGEEILDMIKLYGNVSTEITMGAEYTLNLKINKDKITLQVCETMCAAEQLFDDYIIKEYSFTKEEIINNISNLVSQIINDCEEFEKIKYTIFLDIDRIEKDILEVMNSISYEDFDEDGIAKLSIVEINKNFSVDFAFCLKGKKVLLDYFELYYQEECLVDVYSSTIKEIKKNPRKLIYFLMDEIDSFLHED